MALHEMRKAPTTRVEFLLMNDIIMLYIDALFYMNVDLMSYVFHDTYARLQFGISNENTDIVQMCSTKCVLYS